LKLQKNRVSMSPIGYPDGGFPGKIRVNGLKPAPFWVNQGKAGTIEA
jgi:hypothetical protein